MLKVILFHNILWSKYKGGVFSKLSEYALSEELDVKFVQIAETEGDRVGLSNVDMSYHTYPFTLLNKGSYENVSPWKLSWQLFSLTFKSDADLILIAGYHKIEFWAQLLACVLRFKKRSVFCDSTAYDRPHGLLKNLAKFVFFHSVNSFFAYGVRSKEYICSFGIKEEKVFYRCQAAALPHNYSEKSALENRILNAQLSNQVRYLYAGRLSEEKDLHILLAAMALVLKTKPDSRLTVVGSGPLNDKLIQQAQDLHISHAVNFTGGMDINALALEYAKANFFVLPSHSEPWGLVINEALSFGCPVVVSHNCGCVPELVVEGVTGSKFNTGDANDLARVMLKVSDEMTNVEETAKACIAHISKYSAENAAKQIINGIHKTLNKS